MNLSYPFRKKKSLNRLMASSNSDTRRFERHPSEKLLLAVLVLNPIAAALADNECGIASSSGDSITCTASNITGNTIRYNGVNVDLTLDGTAAGSIHVDKVDLISSNIDDQSDLSITAKGSVFITGTNDSLIHIDRFADSDEHTADVSLKIAGNTKLNLTGTNDYPEPAIFVRNKNNNDNETSHSTVIISAGANITVDSQGYYGKGIEIYHYGNGALDMTHAGQVQVSAGGTGYSEATAIKVNADESSITKVNIMEDAQITVDAETNATGVNIHHNADSEISVIQAGTIQVSSQAMMYGLILEDVRANLTNVKNTGQIELENNGTGNVSGFAIHVMVSAYDDVLPVNANITHSGTIVGGVTDPDNDDITGIYANFGDSDQSGVLQIISSGNITKVNQGIVAQAVWESISMDLQQTAGLIEAEKTGILAMSEDSGDVHITTSGQIKTGKNQDAKGIYITSSSGGLAVLGQAIIVQNAGGDIFNQGNGGETAAIHVEAAQVSDITVAGRIRSSVGAGVYLTEVDRTYINTEQTGTSPPVFVLDNRDRTFKVNLQSGGIIEGGSQEAGISTVGGNSLDVTIAGGSTFGALSDIALHTVGYTTSSSDGTYWYYDNGWFSFDYELPSVSISAAPTILHNSGVMTGIFQLGSGKDNFTNESVGVWNLRSFADTDDDGVRDTLSVAVARFSTGGSGNSIINRGTINLLNNKELPATLDDSKAYDTGYTANAMALNGAVQGHILGVQTFSNSGTIDLSGTSAVAGDVLLISGGDAPGTPGNGVFIANGGLIKVDTVLNEGGTNSRSDMLVVDTTQLGSAVTAIEVKITSGAGGAQTVANGIELVHVLDSTKSATGVFQLNGRLVAGAYDYDLYHGGVGADAGNGNWYLRSIQIPTTNPVPQPPLSPRAETGLYLRNMSLAANMFVHTLHDRLSSTSDNRNAQKNAPGAGDMKHDDIPMLWGYISRSHSEGLAANRQVDAQTDTTRLHLGRDVFRWETPGGQWNFGLMGAYGRSDTDTRSRHVGHLNNGITRTAKGTVEGYSVGAYATWYGGTDKPTDLYVDLWAQHGWYDNTVKGNALRKEDYDSRNWTVSIESGWASTINDSEQRQWLIEPQIQLAYSRHEVDNHQEYNGTNIQGERTSGITSRLGARLFSRGMQNAFGIQPFVETNWWHSSTRSSLSFDEMQLRDDIPKNRYELKTGFHGEFTKGFQVWGHLSLQQGSDDYRRYEGAIGFRKEF